MPACSGDRRFAGERYVRVPRCASPGRCAGTVPVEATTDRRPAYPRIPDELIPTTLYSNGSVPRIVLGVDVVKADRPDRRYLRDVLT
jgi:hypothetical protein